MPHVTEEIWTNLPARETRLIVAPWPEPQTEDARLRRARRGADGGAHLPAQRRPDRSSTATRCGSSRRSSGPRATGRATSRPSGRASRRRSTGPSGCSRTRSSSRTPIPRPSTPSARSSRNTLPSATRWVESLSPWPRTASGPSGCARCSRELGDPAARFDAIHVVGTNGKSTTTRLTGRSPRRSAGRRPPLAARLAAGTSGSRSTERRPASSGDRRVRPAAEELGATQFEMLTAAAFADFAAGGGRRRRGRGRARRAPRRDERHRRARRPPHERRRSSTRTCSATRARRSRARSSRSCSPGAPSSCPRRSGAQLAEQNDAGAGS